MLVDFLNYKILTRNSRRIGLIDSRSDSAWNDTKTVKVGYLYDAMGTKLRKYSTQGGNRDYIDGIEYNGTLIELIHTDEGVAFRNSKGTYTYRYNLTDHLENVRSSIYRNPSNNLIEV